MCLWRDSVNPGLAAYTPPNVSFLSLADCTFCEGAALGIKEACDTFEIEKCHEEQQKAIDLFFDGKDVFIPLHALALPTVHYSTLRPLSPRREIGDKFGSCSLVSLSLFSSTRLTMDSSPILITTY